MLNPVSAVEAHRFAEMANPHGWLETAESLHRQAVHLYEKLGEPRFGHLTGEEDRIGIEHDVAHRATFLLGGFALENLLKAHLVYEHPHWISNGTLARPLRSHWLTELHGRSKLVPEASGDKEVLETFGDGLESWARYPCALHTKEMPRQIRLANGLWDSYRGVIAVYSDNLKRLLEGPWRGPHGLKIRSRAARTAPKFASPLNPNRCGLRNPVAGSDRAGGAGYG